MPRTLQLRHLDATFCLLSTTLAAAMNTMKSGVGSYIAVSVYLVLWMACVMPRLTSFARFPLNSALSRLNRHSAAFLALGFLTAIAYLRALALPEVHQYIIKSSAFFLSIWIFALISVRKSASAGERSTLKAIIYSSHVYVLINLIAYAMGLRRSLDLVNFGDYGDAKMFALLGVHTNRILLPFVPSLTAFGLVAGAALCVALVGTFAFKGRERFWNIVMVPLSLLALLLTDARGSMLATLIAIVGFLALVQGRRLSWVKYLILPSSLLFLLFFAISAALYGTGSVADLARGDSILSGREVIWGAAIPRLLNDPVGLIFGHGYMGHYASGVTTDYVYLFLNWQLDEGREELYTLHNSFLQLVYDQGLLGYVAMIAALSACASRLVGKERHGKTLSGVVAVYIIYLVVAGASDVSLTVYTFLTYFPAVLLICFGVYAPKGLCSRRARRCNLPSEPRAAYDHDRIDRRSLVDANT